jgi:group I intron endonuclease
MAETTCWKTGVYCWRNLVNGKVYVGGAYRSFSERFGEYRQKFKVGQCHNRHLQAAWDLYGSTSFRLSILERCPPEQVEERENYWIAKLNAADPEHGYNVCKIAFSRLGVVHTPETKAKMSAAKKGKPGSRTGAVLSEETKARIRAAKLGKPSNRRGAIISEETRRRLRLAAMGSSHSAETKAKMSASHKRRWAEKRKQNGTSEGTER